MTRKALQPKNVSIGEEREARPRGRPMKLLEDLHEILSGTASKVAVGSASSAGASAQSTRPSPVSRPRPSG